MQFVLCQPLHSPVVDAALPQLSAPPPTLLHHTPTDGCWCHSWLRHLIVLWPWEIEQWLSCGCRVKQTQCMSALVIGRGVSQLRGGLLTSIGLDLASTWSPVHLKYMMKLVLPTGHCHNVGLVGCHTCQKNHLSTATAAHSVDRWLTCPVTCDLGGQILAVEVQI